MNARKRVLRVAAAAAGLAFAASAYAGGPLSICNLAPVRYSPPTVTLSYDQGTLGTRTKTQADTIVTNAVALWTNVPTSNVVLARGADLPVDVTTANYTTYISNSSIVLDGINPVIYDTNGSIIDLLLGSGASSSVLGFAGSGYYTAPTCRFAEGYAVINGVIPVTDATMSIVMAHEIGHLIGLDHTQLDGAQGLVQSDYPLMYPIAYRNMVSLGDDDASAVTALYPDTSVNAAYGQVNGNFLLADGVTPVRGANLWARENTSGKVYSVVSDYLTQNTGYFSFLLPPGTYTLHAEAIRTDFTGGSSVGPYSESSSDPSFQSPLYVGGTPMTPLTLGNGSPTPINVTAGCAGTVSFRFNGTGTVGGNCVVAPVAPAIALTSMPNPAISPQVVTLVATVSGSAGTPTGTVDFRDGGVSIGGCAAVALSSGSATCPTAALATGTRAITAVYSGNSSYTTGTSAVLSQVVYAAGVSNVARASNGAVASAPSTLSGYPVTRVNNGDRTGAGMSFWVDNTPNAFPDSVQIVFNGSKTIDRVIVYSLQDNYTSPIDPTDTTTFTIYGLAAFTVEGWNGASWVNLGTVTGNNLVKRTVTFSAFTTDRIRINVNAATGYSRIVEIEAMGY